MKKLVIVESPTKAKTISRFLGRSFTVESSFGHIRDLPSSTLGVDTENNFEPKYVIPKKAKARVKELKLLAKEASEVILATDEDREGEAIAWHLIQALDLNGKKPSKAKAKSTAKTKKTTKEQELGIQRIVFHEITKDAIHEALEHPRKLDMHLVNAQQARRVLDRLVGYKLSPFLWKKIARGLSAGRVQSVAVRLIVEREREIKEFKPEEYWSITARFASPSDSASVATSAKGAASAKDGFEANLYKKEGAALDKMALKTQTDAAAILKDLDGEKYKVTSVEKKAVEKHPQPPFTTSTLQQTASSKFGYSSKFTMRIAQELYEGIDIGEAGSVGLITYMRTDSVNLAESALNDAKSYLTERLGDRYALPQHRRYKTKSKNAQEAHEAIRPTNPFHTPESLKSYLSSQQFKLYQLIWQRFMATQMPSAILDATGIDIEAGIYTFRATGSVVKFDGFTHIYPLTLEETVLPEVTEGEVVDLKELSPKQHFTEPPPRYTEASLIKILERNGIGRPSTYAPTMSTIQDRGYVIRNQQKRFEPTEMGGMVNDLLVENFPEVVDIQFTAKMEEDLDKIAAGEAEWEPVIKEFYDPFAKNLAEKYESVEKRDTSEVTDIICDLCGKNMVIKRSRFGKFLGCSGFPDCRNIKPLPEASLGIKCPKCKEGDVISRNTRRGKVFYGCSRYPDCDFAVWDKPTGEMCGLCSSPLVEKGKDKKILCSHKECENSKK